MKRILMSSVSIVMMLFFSGCTTTKNPNEFASANKIIDRTTLIQVPATKTNYRLVNGNDPALERAFNQFLQTGKAPNILTDGFIKFAYNVQQQPIVNTTPFQETVISLEPGERFTNVTSGDPGRWSYSAAVSGSGASSQQNILVKPSLPNISTNMVITTDKRIYNLRLNSSMSGLTRNISFWYPDEMVDAVNNVILKKEDTTSVATVPNVNLNNLNFNYSISTDGFFKSMPSWKPTRVFDDGQHTYIQFPIEISNRDMPALFVLQGDTKELVNYHVKAPYFVVDKIFKKSVLIMGVGQDQSKVIIDNNHYS